MNSKESELPFPLGDTGHTLSYSNFLKAFKLAEKWAIDTSLEHFLIRECMVDRWGVDTDIIRQCFAQGLVGVDWHIVCLVIPRIKLCSGNNLKVLITGATGTGKEIIARCIHNLSSRKIEPFLAINCAELSAEHLHSDLFGHVKGSYTGATHEKKGLVEEANKGTLFIDEIGEMQPEIQADLLRFLESGEYRRLGDSKGKTSNARIIAATNRNLEQEMSEGRFRKDLYFRFEISELKTGSLYQRPGDLPLLVYYFIKEFNAAEKHAEIQEVDPILLIEALHYEWPGNVRELRNRITNGCYSITQRRGTSASVLETLGLGTNIPAPLLKNLINSPFPVIQIPTKYGIKHIASTKVGKLDNIALEKLP